MVVDKSPKASAAPTFSIDSPSNYSLFGKLAPNYSLTITAGIGNFTWYEFLGFGVNSTPIELEGTANEYFEAPFNQTMWDSLNNGTSMIRFYVNNSLGETGYLDAIIRIDIINPTLIINSPQNLTRWNIPPNIQVTAIDPNLHSVWYAVGATNITLESGVSETFDSTIWSGLPNEGLFTINFFANDSAGNINNTYTLTLYKDVITPTLTIDSPANNTYWNSIPDVQAIASDTYFDSVWYMVSGTKIKLENGLSEPLDSSIWSGLANEGQFTIYFYANDSAGNINNTYTLTLYKDVITPILSINSPADNTYWNTIPNVQATASDTYFDSVWYVVSGTKILLESGVSEPLDSSIWSGLANEGQFTIYFYANDSAGNINNTYTLTLYKDIVAPRLTLQNPLNGTQHNTRPPINILVYEPNFGSLTYTVLGYSPLGLINNTDVLLSQTIWNSLPQEEFFIVITCFDTLGQSSNLTITLFKDTIAPVITINSPVNNTYWNLAPYLNVSAVDPNLNTTWYSVDNVNVTLQNNIRQQLDNSIWNNLPDEGQFEVKIYANDSFGHLNYDYTLTFYRDVVTPTLIINSPLNNTYHKVPPIINVTIIDSYFHSLWYRVGTQDIALTNNTNQQLNITIWDSLADEGSFIIYFYANDSAGNLNNFSKLDLNKDIINPEIIINNLNPFDLFGKLSPNFDISIIEPNLNQTWYMLYNQTWNSLNYSFNGFTEKINQVAWDGFWNGTVTIRFYANDTLNNLGFSEVSIRKNIFIPVINIGTPYDNDLFGIGAPNITIYKSGLALNTTWYTIDNGVTNFTFSGLSVIIDQDAWDIYGFSDITITFYINDSLGEIGFDEITLRKDPNPPEVSITFIFPATNNSYCAAEPSFRISAYDPNLYSTWYRVGLTNITIINDTILILNDTIWNNLPQGLFTIEVFAIDILWYLNDSVTLSFMKDTIAPTLVINQPYDENYYNTPPPINITVFDPNFSFITYTVIGYSPVLLANNTEVLLNQAIWDSLPQGGFLVSITAYDSFGHLNDTYVLTLYKDTTGPIIETLLPADNSYHKLPPIIKAIATDPNLHTIWYKVGTSFIELFNNTEQALDLSIWNGIEEGFFNVEIYANDSFGYMSSLVNLTLVKDITAPSISIIFPLNNTYYSTPPNININTFDVNIHTVWYSVMGTIILLSGGTEPLDAMIWDSLGQGEFDVFIFANDSAGNLNNSVMLSLYKDTMAPLVTVNSPLNNTHWNSLPILNIAAYDPNLDTIRYKISSFVPLSIANNTDVFLHAFIWGNLTEGENFIEIIVEDTLGNINSSIKLTIYKDISEPIININLPQSYDIFGETTPNFDISVIENYLNTTWYTLIGEGSNFLFSGFTGTINQTAWDTFGNGTVVIRIYANDFAGNLGYEDIIVRKNLFSPIITVNSPGDNELFGSASPDFIIYKSGSEIQSTWYTIDNGITNITFFGLSGSIDQLAWDVFGYQTITLTFYINDSLGKIGSDNVNVRKDPEMPIILFNSPINQTPYASPPFINLTITEPNLHKVWYCFNNITIDISNNLSIYLDSLIWDSLPQGDFIINFFANDTLGNLNSYCNLNLSKDTTGPFIDIVQPTENEMVDRNAPFFELSIFDENGVDSYWYTINGNITPTKFTGSIGRIDQNLWENIWDNYTQGSIITIRFYANDTLGNIDYSEIHLIIDKPINLPKLVLYPLGFLIPTLGLVAMVPLTLKLAKTRYYKSLNKKDKIKLRNALITAGFFLSLITLYLII